MRDAPSPPKMQGSSLVRSAKLKLMEPMRSGGIDTTSLSSQLSCGIGHSTQLGASIGRSRDDFGHANSFALNGKTNLFKGSGSDASYTIAYGIAGIQPEGLSLRSQSAYLNGVVSKPLTDNLTGHLNFGLTHDRSLGKTMGTWNVAAEYALGHGVDVMAEAYGQEGSGPWVGVGSRWQANKSWSIGASLSRQSSENATQFTLGAKYSF